MSKNAKIAVGGVAVGLLLLIWLPWWAAFLIVVGVPAAAYLALDPRSGAGCAASHARRSAAEAPPTWHVSAQRAGAERSIARGPAIGMIRER